MNRHVLDWTFRIVVIVAAVAGPRTCPAQGTLDDYARADALRAQTRGKVFGGRVEPHFYAGGDRFWYRGDRADGAHEFIIVDAVSATRRPAFDHARLAAALTRATEKPHEATRLPLDRIEIAEDGSVRFEAHGRPWRYDTGADILEPGEPLAPLPPPARTGRGGRRRGAIVAEYGVARRQICRIPDRSQPPPEGQEDR